MSTENKGQQRRNKQIGDYMKFIREMAENTDDYLFIIEYDTRRIFFTNQIEKRYCLPTNSQDGMELADWEKTIYVRDVPLVREDLCKQLSGEKDIHNMEYRLLDRNGIRTWISCRSKVLYDGEGAPLLVLGRVSDTALGQKTDPMTGLLNGRKYMEDVAVSLRKSVRGCLIIFGLDYFKEENIRNGRAYGDNLIKHMTSVLEDIVDPAYFIYRLEGDRFALNLTLQGEKEARRIFEDAQAQMSGYIGFSAGAVLYGGIQNQSAELLYQHAESALDRAKKMGRNRLAFFSAEDYTKLRDMAELTLEIRQSVQDMRGFQLYYQPQIALNRDSLYGVEALLRYDSPAYGSVSPAEFIPILESTDLIVSVGKWVLKNALKICSQWRKTIPDLHISVNLSYRQLREPGIAGMVLDALHDSGLPGNALTLELTESIQLQDYQYFNQIFWRWKNEGILISIDDFGTGYSSLSYLKSIAMDEIKIDRCFVKDIQHSEYGQRLVKNTIDLARISNIGVCCEGVETEDELEVLRELKPDRLQGFLFSKPVPPKDFEAQYLDGKWRGKAE